MKKIVITVDGGVANYNCDAGIEVLILDIDNLRDGEVLTSLDIAGFEHLIDDYYMNYIKEDGYKDLVKGDGVYYNSEYYKIMSINTDNGLVESPIDKITIIDEYKGSGSIIEVFAHDIELKTPVDDDDDEIQESVSISDC